MTPENANQLATDWARSGGYTLTPAAQAIVAERISTTLERDGAGFNYLDQVLGETFKISSGQAVDVPVGEFVVGLLRRHGEPIVPAPAASAPGSHAPVPTRPKPGAAVSDFGKAFAAQHDAAMVRETASMKNPWLPSQINRTNQQIIINKNPALAARFKAEAGL